MKKKRTMHPDEEALVLHVLGEGDDPAGLELHLASCDTCREARKELLMVLEGTRAAAVPDPGEDYEARVWQRLAPRLEKRPSPWWVSLWQPRRLAFVGAVAVLLVAAFVAGRHWPATPLLPSEPGLVEVFESTPQERIYAATVGRHLESTRMALLEVSNIETNGSVDISLEQQWARDLVSANRLYRQTAMLAGETTTASVLDELERVLLEIANSPSQLSAEELEDIRARIEAQELIFKVRVLGSQLRQRERVFERQLGEPNS
jgi:hypothetical protein